MAQQSPHARLDVTAQKWCVGNRRKTWINTPTEQRETWLLARSNGHPFWHFHPEPGFLYGHLAKSSRPGMPERGLSGVHGPFPCSGITGESPLVVRTAVNRRFSSWMRAGIDPVVAGPCRRWKYARSVLPGPIKSRSRHPYKDYNGF